MVKPLDGTFTSSSWAFWITESIEPTSGGLIKSTGDTLKRRESFGQYKAGLKNGNWTEYYDTGKMKSQGAYLGDKQVGKWSFFNEDGTISKTETFWKKLQILFSLSNKLYLPSFSFVYEHCTLT